MNDASGVLNRSSMPRMIRAAALLLTLAVSACASLPPLPPIGANDVEWAVRGAGMAQEPVAESGPALMRVSDEMRRFARKATDGVLSSAGRVDALVAAIGDRRGLNLRYDPTATLTADEAFQQRRANCLSYTMLFTALARDLGIVVRFNDVEIPPVWDSADDKTLLLYKHINARVELISPRYQIVDVSGEEYDLNFPQRVISDDMAAAQYYNNRAVELRLQKRYPAALGYQLKALALQPDGAYLWTNLAGLYLASGNTAAARVAVTRALTLDDGNVLNYNTAAQVYAALGRPDLARAYGEKAQQALDRNAYYHYQLALVAIQDRDDHQAYSEVRRALLLYPHDPRFFYFAASLLEKFGERERAESVRQLAQNLMPDAEQGERYRSKFARLTAHG